MRVKHAAVVAGLALGLMSGTAKAAYILDIDQVGGNVVATGSGRIDTSGLDESSGAASEAGFTGPSLAFITVGNGSVNSYTGISGPSSFGTGGSKQASTSSGAAVTIFGARDIIRLPAGYVSDASLGTSIATFFDATFESLGLTPGSYTYMIPGAGPESLGDTFTVKIGGSVSAVPLPASAPMFGAALLALGAVGYGVKRKKAAAAT